MVSFLSSQVRTLAAEYTRLSENPSWILASGIGFFSWVIAFAVNHVAGTYATSVAGAPTGDLLLEFLPHYDTALLHVTSSNIFIAFVIVLMFTKPRYVPFMLISSAAVSFTRSLCISATHLGIYPDAPAVDSLYTFGGDLFFSGHVAFPVLFGFVFWKYRTLRTVLFASGAYMGLQSLVGHLHYTIDVLAAPFFAYGIFSLVRHVFPAIAPDRYAPVKEHPEGVA